MTKHGWIVTFDHLENSDVSIVGPRGIDADIRSSLEAGAGEDFRMYDDDGELYYAGRFLALTDAHPESQFSPLDDYGMPNAGCTEIRYKSGAEWKTL